MRLPLTLAALCAVCLAACGEESTAVDYVPDPGAPGRADCVESDFGGSPLQGPGFTDGVYTGPADAPLLASSTVLYLLPGDEPMARFGALLTDVQAELMRSEGLLGIAFGGSAACGSNRTLAVWRDMDAMMGFVGSEAHVAAMIATSELADAGTRTVHWTVDPAVEEVTWEAGVRRAREAAPVGGLGDDR